MNDTPSTLQSRTCIVEGCTTPPIAIADYCEDHRVEGTKLVSRQARAVRTAQATEAKAKRAEARGVREAQKAESWDSADEPSDAEIYELLRDRRGLNDLHVIDTVIDLGKTAATMNNVVPSRFYWLNGLHQTLESQKNGAPIPLEPISTDQAKGMVITTRDMHALYDFSPLSWATIKWPLDTFEEFRNLDWDLSSLIEKKGQNVTLEEFHGLRYCSITNTLWAGRWIHGKDFWDSPEGPHGNWERFFPKKTPGLPLDYGTENIKKWFKGLTDGPRKYMLVASRNAYKSSWQVCSEAIPYVLACPDVTILEISAVKNLSKKFIASFREYWTVRDRRKPNIFQMLWPEMMIHAEDLSDSTVFKCPMAKGLYPQPTMASSSVDSSQVGERCLVLCLDDAADEENEATEYLREGLVEKIELIEKLKEPNGIEIIIGTPQANEGDLYRTILDRSEKNNHKYLSYLIQPAWTLRPEARDKNINDVVGSDIESLLFKKRMDFDYLKGELAGGTEKGFRRQNLVQWVDDKDPNLILHFDREMFEKARIPANEVPLDGDVFLTGDLAFTKSIYRDASSFTLHKTVGDKFYALLQSTGHWDDTEKATEIVRLSRLHLRFVRVVLEKYSGHEGLDREIKRIAMLRGVSVSVFWLETDKTADAKFRRLKHNCELGISGGRVKLVMPEAGAPNWIEDLISEVVKLDNTGPKRKSSTIKDDRADSLSLAVKYFLKSERDEDAKAREEMEQKQADAEALQRQYQVIFGSPSGPYIPSSKSPESQEYADLAGRNAIEDSPLLRVLNRAGYVRKHPNEKPLSFSYMKEKPFRN